MPDNDTGRITPGGTPPQGGIWTIAWSAFAIFQVPVFFNNLTPPLTMVATSGRDVQTKKPEVRYWVRRGEVFASAFSVLVGSLISYVANSAVPFWAAVLVVGINIYLYEHALRGGIGLAYNPFT